MRGVKIHEKQRRLAKIMANGTYETKGEALNKAGYSSHSQRNPGRSLTATGFLLAIAEEAGKVGNIIDRISAELETVDFQGYTALELVSMQKTLSETQKNIMQSLPQQAKKPQDIHVIDLD